MTGVTPNNADLPADTMYSFKDSVDTKDYGTKADTVIVTYPDGTTDTVDVTVNVVPSDADKNDVKAADGVTTDLNKVPDAKDSVTVTDAGDNPVTEYEANWTKEPDVTKPGKSTGTVEVTYPDGSKETVEVPVTVRDENGQTQADKNMPKEPADKTSVGDKGNLIDSEKDAVKQAVENGNKDGNGDSTLPDGTKVTEGTSG